MAECVCTMFIYGTVYGTILRLDMRSFPKVAMSERGSEAWS